MTCKVEILLHDHTTSSQTQQREVKENYLLTNHEIVGFMLKTELISKY